MPQVELFSNRPYGPMPAHRYTKVKVSITLYVVKSVTVRYFGMFTNLFIYFSYIYLKPEQG